MGGWLASWEMSVSTWDVIVETSSTAQYFVLELLNGNGHMMEIWIWDGVWTCIVGE